MKPPADAAASLLKMPTGIDGLNEVLRGGLPRKRATVVLGGPGKGTM